MKQVIKQGGQIDALTYDELAELLQQSATSQHIGYGSGKIERKLNNWPVEGHERVIRVNTTHGTNNLVLAAATYTDVLIDNDGRGGLSLINIGSNPTFVFLATKGDAQAANGAVASGYLPASGTWDGKIGDAQWTGAVSALSTLGTTLVVAEV